MTSVEVQLAQWRSQYGELVAAELDVRRARAHLPSSSAAVAELEAQVRRMQQACNATLDAVSAALAENSPNRQRPTSGHRAAADAPARAAS